MTQSSLNTEINTTHTEMKKHQFMSVNDMNDMVDSIEETVKQIENIKRQGYWSMGYDLADRNAQNATEELADLWEEAISLLKEIAQAAVSEASDF